jgi:hypothetical protein
MLSIVLSEIETMINRLSRQEQLWLIEKLARRLRDDSMETHLPPTADFKSQLVLMANDPEVQAELRKIDQEFALTETDGLEEA